MKNKLAKNNYLNFIKHDLAKMYIVNCHGNVLLLRQLLQDGQSLPIPRHSQILAKNAGLVTLET